MTTAHDNNKPKFAPKESEFDTNTYHQDTSGIIQPYVHPAYREILDVVEEALASDCVRREETAEALSKLLPPFKCTCPDDYQVGIIVNKVLETIGWDPNDPTP